MPHFPSERGSPTARLLRACTVPSDLRVGCGGCTSGEEEALPLSEYSRLALLLTRLSSNSEMGLGAALAACSEASTRRAAFRLGFVSAVAFALDFDDFFDVFFGLALFRLDFNVRSFDLSAREALSVRTGPREAARRLRARLRCTPLPMPVAAALTVEAVARDTTEEAPGESMLYAVRAAPLPPPRAPLPRERRRDGGLGGA
jgi:hypothetical protein